MQKVPRRSGFTLIELLVVIAIIAILAAILFPVFQKVRENARRTSCASNEKQIGIAFTQYEQDADEQTPGSTQWGYGWAEKIQPFVKSAQVFQCPDDTHTTDANPPAPAPAVSRISYAMNGNLRQNCNNAICTGSALSMFQSPSNTVLVVECAINGRGNPNQSYNINDPNLDVDIGVGNQDRTSYIAYGSNDGNDGHPAIGDPKTYNGKNQPAFHDPDNGSLNYLAFDGHVKYLKKTAVSGAYFPPGAPGTVSVNNLTPYVMTYSLN